MAVNSLSELKEKLEKLGLETISFNGLSLENRLGSWILLPGEGSEMMYPNRVLLNKELVLEKNFKDLAETPYEQ